jgi:hypothetical protein
MIAAVFVRSNVYSTVPMPWLASVTPRTVRHSTDTVLYIVQGYGEDHSMINAMILPVDAPWLKSPVL